MNALIAVLSLISGMLAGYAIGETRGYAEGTADHTRKRDAKGRYVKQAAE